jgi:catechol 2,3-dioxygenase-like lactoylglutathione lyase family enzyme
MKSYEQVAALSVRELRERYGRARPDGVELSGVNHVAWVSSDMARTVWFWAEGLGMRLTKTIALSDGGQHFFLDGGRGASMAYFWFPDAPKGVPGLTTVNVEAAATGSFATAHGSVNHVAWNVPADKLREYRRRIKALDAGFVSPMLFHTDMNETGYAPVKDENTTWESFYFVGPDGEYCELTAMTDRPFSPELDINHKPATAKDALNPPSSSKL